MQPLERDQFSTAERSTTAPSVAARVAIVAFDFAARVDAVVPVDQLQGALADGKFCWIDIEGEDAAGARQALSELALCPNEVVDSMTGAAAAQLARYESCLHLVLPGCRLTGHSFDLERVDVVVAEQYLLTVHRGRPEFIEVVRSVYHADFVRFAQSPSFLLYELWDHLIKNYLRVHNVLEVRVERLQGRLLEGIDADVFADAFEVSADILHLRKVLLPVRAVLSELSTRKTRFVSEATQRFLGNMVGTVERVVQDVLVDHEILAGALKNRMTLASHQTSKMMNRLSVVSVIFMPLTFLCGVYGMNFEVLPELRWKYGYLAFWIVALTIAGSLVWAMRRTKVL